MSTDSLDGAAVLVASAMTGAGAAAAGAAAAAAAGTAFLVDLRLCIRTAKNARSASRASPPSTPPMIAPMLTLLLLPVSLVVDDPESVFPLAAGCVVGMTGTTGLPPEHERTAVLVSRQTGSMSDLSYCQHKDDDEPELSLQLV